MALTALRGALDRGAPPAARHPANPASANQFDRVRITIPINSKYVRYTSRPVSRRGHFVRNGFSQDITIVRIMPLASLIHFRYSHWQPRPNRSATNASPTSLNTSMPIFAYYPPSVFISQELWFQIIDLSRTFITGFYNRSYSRVTTSFCVGAKGKGSVEA